MDKSLFPCLENGTGGGLGYMEDKELISATMAHLHAVCTLLPPECLGDQE